MIKVGIPAQDQPEEKFGVNSNYLEFIENIGRPVILYPEKYDDFKQIYNLDALVLPGGADINSSRYSPIPHLQTNNPNIFLEHFDTNILPNLIGKMPIFGICRGLQTLNVLFGGTLRNLWWHPYSTYETHTVHNVWTLDKRNNYDKKNTFKEGLNGVNSYHHQGIKDLGRNLAIELIDFEDNVVEAISNKQQRIFAVQWHPERLLDNYSISKFFDILK